MASQTQAGFTPAQITQLNELGSRAGSMVYKLAQKPPSTGSRVQQVTDFQHIVNQYKALFQASIVAVQPDWVPTGYSAEFFGPKGLAEDGIYGPKTGTALALVLYTRGVAPSILGTIPTRGADISLWYATYKDVVDSALIPLVVEPDLPPAGPAPQQDPVQQVIDDAKAPPAQTEVIIGPAEDIQFDDGSSVLAPRPEKASNVPLIALGVGTLVAGGFIFYALRKKKGR